MYVTWNVGHTSQFSYIIECCSGKSWSEDVSIIDNDKINFEESEASKMIYKG